VGALLLSGLVAFVFFVINSTLGQFFTDLSNSCGCFGPNIDSTAAVKRIIATLLLLLTLILLKYPSFDRDDFDRDDFDRDDFE